MSKSVKTQKVVIDVLRDICISGYKGSRENLAHIIETINKSIMECDYQIANFEGVVLDDKVSNTKPIIKDGPTLNMDYSFTEFLLEKLDINAYCLANNHIGDFGSEGVRSTRQIIEKTGKRPSE